MFSQSPSVNVLYSVMSHHARHTLYFRLTHFLILSLLTGLIIFVLLNVYNWYFHPLSNFPRPFWSSVADFYKFFVLSSHDISQLSLDSYKR